MAGIEIIDRNQSIRDGQFHSDTIDDRKIQMWWINNSRRSIVATRILNKIASGTHKYSSFDKPYLIGRSSHFHQIMTCNRKNNIKSF